MKSHHLPILIFGLIFISFVNVKSHKTEPAPHYRLPGNLIPTHYNIRIRPIIDGDYPGIGERNTAPGSVSIAANCVQSTSRIVMHSEFLQINESSIRVLDSTSPDPIDVAGIEYDEDRNFLIIKLVSGIRNGTTVDISMNFIANVDLPLGNSLRGLYSKQYWNLLANETKVMAATKLQPLLARRVFPCFDEPTYKVPFDVVVGRTENYSSLANGQYLYTELDSANPGWYFDHFATTVPMPTYLVAMAIHDFGYSQAPDHLYRLPVRVYGRRHFVNEGKAQLTANASAMLLRNFEGRFGIPHHMDKVDSFAVPNTFAGMENYGLIIYGEQQLIYHEGTTTSKELRANYNMLAHEVAHQWFGNLVTCKWWSDIWLNEGFGMYWSYIGLHDVFPEFDSRTEMLDPINGALKYDAGPNTHPIHQEAYTAEQISGTTDIIGNQKGAAMARFMASFLGEPVFNTGYKWYLRDHYDGVVEQDDLFNSLNEAAISWDLGLPKNVTRIMHTWTLQSGFPLVRVKLTGEEEFTISQEPWQNANVRNDSSTPGTSWDIPIDYVAANDVGGVGGLLWLLEEEQSKTLTIQNWNHDGWFLINTDAGGYYRTLYDELLTSRILEQFHKNNLPFSAEARIRLLDDQFNLAFQEYIPIQSALKFTKCLQNETDPIIWHTVIDNLARVKNLYRILAASQPEGNDQRVLELSLGSRILKVLRDLPENIHDTPSGKSILRGQLVEWMCTLTLEHSWCGDYTKELLDEWRRSGENPIHTDMQESIYCSIVETAPLGYSWILEQYLKSDDPTQQSRMSAALGCSNNPVDISHLIQLILYPENDSMRIEKSHSIPIFRKLLLHSQQHVLNIERLFLDSPDELPNYYEGDLSSVLGILSPVSFHYADNFHKALVQSVQSLNPDFYDGSLDPILKQIEGNIEWLGVFRRNMTTWFRENPFISGDLS